MRALQSQAGKGEMDKLRRTVEDSGGMAYAQERLDYYSRQAMQAVKGYPESAYKVALGNVVQFNAQRNW